VPKSIATTVATPISFIGAAKLGGAAEPPVPRGVLGRKEAIGGREIDTRKAENAAGKTARRSLERAAQSGERATQEQTNRNLRVGGVGSETV
jgi:hypothetical protein